MNKTIEFLADKVHNGKRADVYLSENINYLTRSQLKKMIEKGNLIINEKIVKSPAAKIKYKDNLSSINGKIRPGIVHRIDKNTSGLLVVAKNNFSHANLSKQFSNHSIKRKYLCPQKLCLNPFF